MDQKTVHRIDQSMNRRDFLRAALGGSAVLTAAGLASCAPQVAATQQAAEHMLVRLLWLMNVEFGGFWAAVDQGYYADEGLDAQFLPGGPGIQVETIVAAGGEPIGVTGAATTFLKSVASGSNLKCIGAVFQKIPSGIMSLPDNPIHHVTDAVGKKIGLQSGARNDWDLLLRKNNLSADQMEIVPVGFDPSPLVAGQVDGIWVYIPNQPNILRDQGIEPVTMLAYDEGDKIYGNIIVALESTIKNKRDMVVRWLRASQKGWQYNKDHAEEIAKLTVEKISPDLGLSLNQQIAENKAQIPLTMSDLTDQKGMLWMDPAIWENFVSLLVDMGQLDSPVSMDQALDLSLLEEASAS